nr:hypothetical protein [Tanacetum cinerariifolium]
CVFDFPEDELEPHPAYDFFAPGPLPGYAGNPNNNNGWLKADDYLLGELEAMVDEPMAVPAIEEVDEPVAEVEEEQMATPVMDMKKDLAALFSKDDDFEDDDISDDDSEGVEEGEVWEVNEEWLMAPIKPSLVPALQLPSIYKVGVIEDLSNRLGNLEYGHGQRVKKVIHVSDAEVSAGVSIGEIGPRAFALEGQVQATLQQRDAQIQQLQTMVSETSSRESTLMLCILGLGRRLAELERRPPGPQ